MEWNQQTLAFLSQSFLDTLSPHPEPRRRAEKHLSDAADSPNYTLAVLRLVAEPSVDEQIRHSAAVNFKNHLKTRWGPNALVPIADAEKEQIKQLIVPLMLSAGPKIQAQLSEALAVIGNHDFPKAWTALLPELKTSLENAINVNDFVSVNGILATVNSLFKKFRYQYKSDPLLLDLKYCLDNFAAPLLSTVESLSVKMSGAGGNAVVVRQLVEAQRLCCRIFYSLNFLDLPEFFEDNADKWMNEFKNYLTVRYPVVEDSGPDGLALVDGLRAAVCDNISHYMEKEKKLFQKYLSGFVEAVWSLLAVASRSPSRERLTVTAFKFLTIVPTMDWNHQKIVDFLSQSFLDTLSPHPEPRRRAERNLSHAADLREYTLVLLLFLERRSVDKQIRHSAAINLKNHLKTRWGPMTVFQKEQTRMLIVPLMLSAGPKIQAQLSEAIAVIWNHDFPREWKALLPQLKTGLENAINVNDFVSVNGILATVNSLFKMFRYQYKSAPLLVHLKSCLDNFAAPLLSTVERLSVKMSGAGGNAVVVRQLVEAQRLCCRIFYSLNFWDLPEFFEDNADTWMNEFKNYLTVRYPVVEDSGPDGLALVDGLRVAVFDNINHHMQKEEELFQKYLSGFVEAVCSLLVVASGSPSREWLNLTAIKFLTIVSTSVHHALFAGDEILQQITQSIVIPNVMLREEDEELFEMNYIEFIRRDMEGRDLDTRRRIACELLKGIAGNYKEKITAKVSEQIRNCLALFEQNPAANWKYKDCAIYLVVSLATKKAGGASVSTDLVDVDNFFRTVIVPELQGQDVNAFPMLKAGALKFFTTFRVLIPKPVAMALLGDVVRFLSSDVNVVHSYAASCIEKLLLVKDNGVQPRYTALDVGPILPALMTNLFGALEKPESEENQYIMRCIMRVLQIADISPEVASPCITGLTTVLNRVCANPKNPVFNHCLFEAVAALVRRACERNPTLVPAFEQCLLPSLQMILQKEVTEFFPYAFQLLAQLVDLNRPPVPPHYMQIFDILLTPDLWKKSANVPALVRLLQSFLQQAPNELTREGKLRNVLGIFNKLVSSPSTEEQGFHILNPVIENLGYNVLAEYMNHIWATLFTRLQNNKTPRLVRCLIIFMSLFLVKHGIQTLVDSVNSVQANLFNAILGQFWIPTLKTITGNTEVKLSAVASAKLLCESPSLLDPAAEELWGKLLDGIVTLLSQPEEQRVEDEPEVRDFGEATGYQATFVRLHNAGRREEDPLREIQDPKQFCVALLANLSNQFRGRFPAVITRHLSQANQAALLQLCNSYNLAIV